MVPFVVQSMLHLYIPRLVRRPFALCFNNIVGQFSVGFLWTGAKAGWWNS